MFKKQNIVKLVLHLSVMLLLLVVVLNLTIYGLKAYTNHGESIGVPDLVGMKIDELEPFMQNYELQYVIIDSISDNRKPKGIVIDQDPPKQSNVKKNRKIYLTINALSKKMVGMPNISDVSLAQAKATLQSKGLDVGEVTHEVSDCEGCVIRVLYKSVKKIAGEKVPEHAKIDIVVGKLPESSAQNKDSIPITD